MEERDETRLGFAPMIFFAGVTGLLATLVAFAMGEPKFLMGTAMTGLIAFFLVIGKITGWMDGEKPGWRMLRSEKQHQDRKP